MVNIKGIIGNEPEEVNLATLIEQVQNEIADDPLKDLYVRIDSIGGDLDVGIAMHNYLRNMPNKVITECVNNCASAATPPFLAGDERIAGCPIMIHNPYIEGITGDMRILEAAAEWIGEKKKECEKIYIDRTKLDSATISQLMDDETYISPSQAVSFGFATQAKIIAVAKINNPNINKIQNQMSEKKKSIREILGLKPKAKAMELTASDGSKLVVVREDGEPQVGDEASPDGSFIMPDGGVIVVTDGKISEINSVSNEGVEITQAEAEEVVAIIEDIAMENETLKKENDDLKEQIASAKELTKSDEDIAMLTAIMKAGGKEWLAKQCSHYKPQSRTGMKGKNEIQKKESKVSAKLQEIKEKRGIN